MKSLIIFAILALAVMPLAMAENTSGANWDNSSNWQFLNDLREETTGHDHEYTDTDTWRDEYEPKFEMGLGLDLVVYENVDQGYIPDEVTVESKYDLNNKNGSVYLVAKYNIWERFFKK